MRFWPFGEKKKQTAGSSPMSVSAMFPTSRARFSEVYQKNLWGDEESVSGVGSRRDSLSVQLTLSALEFVVSNRDVRSLNDIPCGDFNWIEPFLLSNPQLNYHGFDVVPELISENLATHGARWLFSTLDITSDVPPAADLVLMKDLLNHLTLSDIWKTLVNLKQSGSKYFLFSNNFGKENEELNDIEIMASRYLDLCAAPFNLPPPVWSSSYMGLWGHHQIPSP